MDDLMMNQQQQEANEQIQREQEQIPQQQMREHLTRLQNWGPDADEQNVAERRAAHAQGLIQHQIERNELLQARAQAQLPKAKAKKKAAGSPKQTQKPAGGGIKGWRERRRQRAAARQHNPLADEISYGMMQGLQDEKKMLDNSIEFAGGGEMLQRAEENKVDTRVLQCFVHGYRKGADGEPETRRDADYREQDRRFIDDYISCDAQRRKPHLDRIVEELLSMNITEDMLRPEYLKDHAGEMHNKVGRMVYFDNVYRDPINRDYFDALPQIARNLIETRVMSRYGVIGTALGHAFATKAINFDLREYYPYEKGKKDDGLQMMIDLYEPAMDIARQTMADSKNREQEYIAQEIERQIRNESVVPMNNARNMKQEAETMEGDIGGLNLTGYTTVYSFEEPAKYRKMIETHPEAYQKNPELIDWLYQEFYRSMDSLGDFTLRSTASQGAIDRMREDGIEDQAVGRTLINALIKEQENIQMSSKHVHDHITACADAMMALLRDKELTSAAADVINQFAIGNKRAQQ